MSKRKTHEQFIEELREVDQSIEVLDQYKTAITKMQVRCSVCGHLWETNPSSLLLGRGCPECGKKKIGNALRKSNADFVSELYAINPDIVPLEEYTGNRGKMLLHCNCCGNEWKSTPHDLLSGHGCPKCGYERQKNAQRRSNKDFLLQLNTVNPNITVLDEYVNNHTRIRFQCKECGKIWTTVPNSVLLGHGCPKCARSSTSFLEQVILYAFSQALGEKCVISRDRNLIGMELDVVIPSLKIAYEPGSWAWHYNKKTRDLEKRNRCEEKGYRLISIYTNYKKRGSPFDSDCYTFPINLGNSNWKETRNFVNKLLYEHGIDLKEEQWEKVRTSALEDSRRKTHAEYIDELQIVNPSIKVLGKYCDSSVKVDYECLICGKKWSALPGSVLSGHGCPACGMRRTLDAIRKTHDQFVSEMNNINPKVIILGKYSGNKQKLLCKCTDCDNQWEMTPQNLLKGQGCPKCGRIRAANKNRKTHDQFVLELQQKNPTIIVHGKYIDSSTKIEVECGVCKYIWYANPMTILSGHGCPNCAGSMKKTNMQFKAELKQKLPNIESIDEYLSANKKIRVRCSICGYEWLVRPHDLLRSKGCPICRRNNREKHIK